MAFIQHFDVQCPCHKVAFYPSKALFNAFTVVQILMAEYGAITVFYNKYFVNFDSVVRISGCSLTTS
jgi:hypothetical protein